MDHGKWSQQGVPHKGWECVGMEDLGGLDGICEMCETTPIRYVHHMEHPDYGAVLGVGSVCAGNMEEDYAAAQERERKGQSMAGRRTRWMNGGWRTSANGNLFRNKNGFNIVVSRKIRWLVVPDKENLRGRGRGVDVDLPQKTPQSSPLSNALSR